MTLSAEDVYKFNETLRSLPYEDLWKNIDVPGTDFSTPMNQFHLGRMNSKG